MNFTQSNIYLDTNNDIDRVITGSGPAIHVFDIDGRACLVWLIDANGDGWVAVSQDRLEKDRLEKELIENS